MKNRSILFDGDTFTHGGRTFVVHIEADDDAAAPWERTDCHGPVTQWKSRSKRPGEWVLSSSRGSNRFYDAQEATRIAKRDGWGIGDDECAALAAKLGREPTRGEVVAAAVRRDFELLRGWCNDEWHYVGVCVRHVSQDEDEKYSYALWGIESECDDYIQETAHELAARCAKALDSEAAQLRANLKKCRDTIRELIRDIRESAALRPAVCAAVRARLESLINDRSQIYASMAAIAE